MGVKNIILNKVKEIRNELELSQEDIAKVLNVKRGTYASWECGSDVIPTRQIYKLAEYFKLSIDYLLEISNQGHMVYHGSDINLSDVGNNIYNLRKKNNLSQKDFAESIGINQSTLWAYEKGKTLITLSSLISLAKVYNITIDSILNR